MGTPNPPPVRRLSGRDREVLWLMSQGMTYSTVGRRLGMTEPGAKSAARRAMLKLGAVNIVQAVAVALLEGEIGRWQGCGTFATYQRHRRLYQTADPACLVGKAAHDRAQRAGQAWDSDTLPLAVRRDQWYERADSGKTIRITGVDLEAMRVDAVDVYTNRPTRVLIKYLHQSRYTKTGVRRRYEYVRVQENGE
jgi:DNA-binding CsgD family transcriptional regulator